MIRLAPISLTALALVWMPLTLSAQTSQGGFETMAQPTEDQTECKAPRPPKDLAETAYIRNGYRAISRIMAAEEWRETGSCDCLLTEIEWDEVLEAGEEYRVSDDPKRPFDTSELRERADKLLAERDAACSS
ncbi:hypothetical protein M8007_21805 (plasmid) [Dinoroseobacter shibae]|jgi:hypothetical protein|uniref:hypothetical protein n=1 Tax=Dinoroseobacter shibae TaxID=215813 RepID=UPI0020207B7E|nr:hypothetical protein [Dinoroseobacter shibae]URF49296.1 hypothetical protein M8008_21780 [Dinoroseobacter shibae]URF53603.1 hypothetical protein M8007_21805 [Dinoroseobacter shibae]